jgi:hypothetical protein
VIVRHHLFKAERIKQPSTAPTDPSWPVPAADRVNVRESLFAEAFNRLLQQNRPQADSYSAGRLYLPISLLEQRSRQLPQ